MGLIIVWFVIILIILVVLALVISGIGEYFEHSGKKSSKELKKVNALLNRVEVLARRNQDVNPELSYQILDEINNYKIKELN